MNTTKVSRTLPRTLVADAFAKMHAQADADSTRDEVALHVSDLVKCPREVWARRNGRDMLPADDDTHRKWQYGLDFEATVGVALNVAGYHTSEQQPVRYSVAGAEIVGHPDFVVTGDAGFAAVIEVKTTTFFVSRAGGKSTRVRPTEAKREYLLQAAAYALALDIPTICVVVCCRDSGQMVEFWDEAARYAEELRSAAAIAVALTRPGLTEPKGAEPHPRTVNVRTGLSWQCSYCAYSGCERNTNPAALAVPV